MNQNFMDPWVAIVVDPKRTETAGKVEIGAFRCYPEDYKAPDEVGTIHLVLRVFTDLVSLIGHGTISNRTIRQNRGFWCTPQALLPVRRKGLCKID